MILPLVISLIIFALFFSVLTALYFNWKFSYWSNRRVKTLPVHPVFGSIADVVYKKIPMSEMITKSYKACRLNGDKYIGFYVLNKPVLVVTDLALIKCILGKDFKHFTDRTFYRNGKIDPFSIHLASMRGSEWKSMREKLRPAFTPKKLKTYFLVLKSVGEQFKDILNRATEKPNVLILRHLSSKFVVDVIVRTIFGIECNTLNNLNPELEYFAKNAFSGSFIQNIKIFISILCPGVLDFLRIPLNSRKMTKKIMKITRQIVEYREKNNVVQSDLMHSLIQIRNDSDLVAMSKNLAIEETAAQLTLFFAAGYETTSTNITFVLYEIMSARYLQEKLRSEINDVLKRHNGEITYEALMEMTYLESCIYETLRKHPVVYEITRVCTSDYKVPDDDLLIEKGSTIIIPIINIHHDPAYYPNPENFEPDRFLLENRERSPSYAFLPFGEGPRSCIGSRLAILKIKLFVAILLKDFRVSINLKTEYPMQYNDSSALLKFKEDLLMNIRKHS